jgi:hypothetical protein
VGLEEIAIKALLEKAGIDQEVGRMLCGRLAALTLQGERLVKAQEEQAAALRDIAQVLKGAQTPEGSIGVKNYGVKS